MTSEERHEARYQRRVKMRNEKRMKRSRQCGNFEEIFSVDNLYKSAYMCFKGVGWKHSIQSYRFKTLVNVTRTRKELLEGKYRSKGFVEFDICERGKKRHIKSVHISERVVQRTLCDKILVPTFSAAFIYDNGASLKNKGISFSLKRTVLSLQKHYRKFGNEGYVLTYDFSKYFDNADQRPVRNELERRIHDRRVIDIANQFLEAFGKKGYGLGSQVSQIAAIMLPNKLDHMIKEELQIKGYARYMDDGYLIHQDKKYLEYCLEKIKEKCFELGIILNPKKTKISKLKDGFDFLKVRFKLTKTGKVIKRMSYKSVKTMRRKLKKFKKWYTNGRTVYINGEYFEKDFTLENVCTSYSSWRSHMLWGNNYWHVKKMDAYFYTLFGIHPENKEEWRNVFYKEKEGIDTCIKYVMQQLAI